MGYIKDGFRKILRNISEELSVGHLPAAASEQFIESQKIHARVHCGGRRPVSHFLNNCSKVFVETHPPEVFYKKGVINSLAKFTGNTKT